MKCSRNRRSARSTTNMVTPGSRPAAAAAGARPASRAPKLSAISSGTCRRYLRRCAPRGGPQVYRGADLRYEAELDLDEAVFGRSIEIDAKKFTECELCRGTGAARDRTLPPARPAGAAARCAFPRASSPCSRPAPLPWLGRVVAHPCDQCLGQGRVMRAKKLSVKIPPGSIRAIAYGSSVKARPAAMAARQEICMSRCACESTPSSSAMAYI